MTSGETASESDAAELDALLGEYVIVTKQDAVDAMAAYLAAWLSNVPEARDMAPDKLQEALVHTINVRGYMPGRAAWRCCSSRGMHVLTS